MKFEEDIKDLRKSVLIFIIPFIISFIGLFMYSKEIINQIINLNGLDINNLITITPLESIQTQINTSLTLSLAICIPLLLLSIYLFIKPILKTKKYEVFVYIYSSMILAWLGMIIGSTIFSKYIIKSFSYYQITAAMWSIKSVLSLILGFGLALSLIFQVVILIPIIINIGLITRKKLIKYSMFIFLLIAIISAFITPPDIFSQLIVSIPFYASFWLGIFINKLQEVKNDWTKRINNSWNYIISYFNIRT